MIEFTSEVPFLWRLSAESSEGYCSVSMVVPCPPEARLEDFTIETSVLSLASDSMRSAREETLEWNQEDIDLFLRLINQRRLRVNQPMEDTVRIDLSDPAIVDIINVVAAAGFGMAFNSRGLLNHADGSFPIHSFDVGSSASLNTVNGFKPCVVVDVEDDDVVCVLLDDINPAANEQNLDRLSRHDLLLVKRKDILHPEYAESQVRPGTSTLH